jgi:four helix bundle protein
VNWEFQIPNINQNSSTMTYKYSFENLEIWQIARKLTVIIYKITKSYPEDEKYGIVSQLRRAGVSICSNIAEGNSRTSKKDRAHFIQIAYSSTMEVLNLLIISSDLEFIEQKELLNLRDVIDELANKTNVFHKRILKSGE